MKSIHSPPDEHEDSEQSVAQRLYDEAMSIMETENHKTSADKTYVYCITFLLCFVIRS